MLQNILISLVNPNSIQNFQTFAPEQMFKVFLDLRVNKIKDANVHLPANNNSLTVTANRRWSNIFSLSPQRNGRFSPSFFSNRHFNISSTVKRFNENVSISQECTKNCHKPKSVLLWLALPRVRFIPALTFWLWRRRNYSWAFSPFTLDSITSFEHYNALLPVISSENSRYRTH